MKRRTFFLSIFLLIAFISFLCISLIGALDWTTFSNNFNRTGYQDATVNPSKLDNVWNFTANDSYTSSPVISEGIVYIGNDNGYFYAINQTNGNQIWNYSLGFQVQASSTVLEGVAYIGNVDFDFSLDSSILIYALNATTGDQIWNTSTIFGTASSPVISDGLVYFGSLGLHALNATNGTLVWSNTNVGAVFSSPASYNGVLYVGDANNNIYAINATNGSAIWNYAAGDQIISSNPAVYNGRIYVGSVDNKLYALNATTGTELWNYTTGGNIYSSSAIHNDIVYFEGDDLKLSALNAITGIKIWDYTTGSPLSSGAALSTPALTNNKIYVGDEDGYLYSFDLEDGGNMVRFNLGSAIRSSPAITEDSVYIATATTPGILYAFSICEENWQCTDWSECTGGSQIRSCVDLDACTHYPPVDKPALSQTCDSSGGSTAGGALAGGGGGGGGGSSSTATTASSTLSFSQGIPNSINVDSSNIAVTRVTITTHEAVAGATVSVEAVETLSKEAMSIFGDGLVYQTFEIDTTALNDSSIANVSMNFRINISWIQINGLDSASVKLYRYSGGTWKAFPAKVISTDSKYYYYSAVTPGFSTFSIFVESHDCFPGVLRCFDKEVQRCTIDYSWVTDERCTLGCMDSACIAWFGEGGPGIVILYILAGIVSAGIVLTSYLLIRIVRLRASKKNELKNRMKNR